MIFDEISKDVTYVKLRDTVHNKFKNACLSDSRSAKNLAHKKFKHVCYVCGMYTPVTKSICMHEMILSETPCFVPKKEKYNKFKAAKDKSQRTRRWKSNYACE